MVHRGVTYEAAWVPSDLSARDTATGLKLATDWLLAGAKAMGRRPMLVVPNKPVTRGGPPIIVQLASRYQTTTEKTASMEHTEGPVMSYVPTWKGLEVAVRYAQGAGLVVVEHPTWPMRGWAIDVGATDLSTGETVPDERSDEYRDLLDDLDQIGNNGWSRGFGANMAAAALRKAVELGPLDEADILGAMAARGHYSDSLERLRELIREAGPQ